MQWLTAVLAFATTMLFYAIVVSTLVELIHRFLGLREKGLQLMLESLYSRVVEPKLKKAGVENTLEAADFAGIIMANRALVGSGDHDANLTAARTAFSDAKKALDAQPADQGAQAAFKKAEDALHEAVTKNEQASGGIASTFLRWLLRPQRMNHVPVEIFTQKLADSRIVGAADATLGGMLDDIAQKYVAFGDEASEFFRRRARLFSVLLAFPVAFFFYVHPYDLAQTFIRDPELAAKVAEINSPADTAEGDVAQGATTGASRQPLSEEAFAALPDNEKVEELRRQLDALKQSIATWDDLHIPVGWPDKATLSPCALWQADLRLVNCRAVFWPFFDFTSPSPTQWFWLLVGALLVGLGAPFWAQAVSALIASRAGLDKIAAIVGGDDRGQAARASLAVSRSISQAPTARRTFEVARNAATTKT